MSVDNANNAKHFVIAPWKAHITILLFCYFSISFIFFSFDLSVDDIYANTEQIVSFQRTNIKQPKPGDGTSRFDLVKCNIPLSLRHCAPNLHNIFLTNLVNQKVISLYIVSYLSKTKKKKSLKRHLY